MNWLIHDMDTESAAAISNWRYTAPYDFYNMDSDNTAELMNGSYFTVRDDTLSLIGFFCVGASAQVPAGHEKGAYSEDAYSVDAFVDIGLGLRPDWTGKGFGFEFISSVLDQVEKRFEGKRQRLTVAIFNSRAIRLYEKLGFEDYKQFWNGEREFMVMKRRWEESV